MASVTFVTSNQVIRINDQNLAQCPGSAQIACADSVPQGTAWAVPVVDSFGILSGYDIVVAADKPSPDSIHVLRVWDVERNITYFIAIDDADDGSVFVDNCNACCGTTPVMPTVVIPDPIVEECPCADEDGNIVFQIPMPSNPNSLDLLISGTFNGVAGTPAPAAGGYADATALLTFLNTAVTGWAAYGTWSYAGVGNTTLILTSTTTLCADVEVTLEAASYCFEIPAVATEVNGITIGAPPTTTNFPNIFFDASTAASRQAVIDAISPFLIGTLEIVGAGPYFVKYTGVQLPVVLTLDNVAVVATTFTEGACP